MSETGATPEQIEAAYARVPGIDAMRANDRTLRKSQIRFGARYLVPPGSAIIDPEQRASVRRVAAALEAWLWLAHKPPEDMNPAEYREKMTTATAIEAGDIAAARAIGGGG